MAKYHQTLTYWAPSTLNEYGEQSFLAPVTIPGRFEEKTEMFVDKSTGKEQMSRSVAYIKQDVVENGFLFLGTSSQVKPKNETKTFLIRRFDKIPNVKCNRYIRKIWQ